MTSSRLVKAVFKEKDRDKKNRSLFGLRVAYEGEKKEFVRFRLLRKLNVANV